MCLGGMCHAHHTHVKECHMGTQIQTFIKLLRYLANLCDRIAAFMFFSR